MTNKLKVGDRFDIDGDEVRVATLWKTKQGWTGRFDLASKGDQTREETEAKARTYLRMKMPDTENERIRYVLSVTETTVTFREIWKSGRCRGSYDMTETTTKFNRFLHNSTEISQKKFQTIFQPIE